MDLGSLLVLLVVPFLLLEPRTGSRILNKGEQEQTEQYVDLKQFQIEMVSNASISEPLQQINLTNADKAIAPLEIEEEINHLWNAEPRNQSVFYGNLSSVLHGLYRQESLLQKHEMPLPPAFESLAVKNSTLQLQHQGKVGLKLRESGIEPGFISGELLVDYTNIFELQGVYLESGHVVMSTRSLKFAGPLAIPWLLPSEADAEHAKRVAEYIATQNANSKEDAEYDHLQKAVKQAGNCELVLFGYARSADLSQDQIDENEREAKHKYRPLPKFPAVRVEWLVYSPDCGLNLRIETVGERLDYYQSRIRRAFMIAIFSLTSVMVSFVFNTFLLSSLKTTHSTLQRVAIWIFVGITLFYGSISIVAVT